MENNIIYYKDEAGQLYELRLVDGASSPFSAPQSGSETESSQINDKDVSSSENEDSNSNNCVTNCQTSCSHFYQNHRSAFSWLLLFFSAVGYFVYFGFAINYDYQLAVPLIACTGVVIFCLGYHFLKKYFGESLDAKCQSIDWDLCSARWDVMCWFVYPLILVLAILYLVFIVVRDMKQVQPMLGVVIFMLIIYLTSKHPDKIIWRPVIWGFSLQFLFAIFVLRWEFGYAAVKFLADQINIFIEYGYDGAAVVFGDPTLLLHPFAMMGMSLLLYLGAVMAILFYCGITQEAAVKLGWLLQKTMGTTAIETLNTAANIFLDGMDTMLMLRHYIDKLTLSEFNCFLVGNHATVAGFVFALFVLFGAPPQHLLSAALMSAPATIAICKLNYPETEESRTTNMQEIDLPKGEDVNIFEAAANGCNVAAKVVCSVIACYVAMMGLLSFLNATLEWLGMRVGCPQLSFELICSYIMWPIAFIIGVDASECRESAKLIGIKLFATEILAYQELGRSADKGLLSPRGQALTTYAMCGFSSISTLAIAIGVWQAICPQRVKLMASFMLRVLVEANISCFMTACVAGIFYSEDMIDKLELGGSTGRKDLVNWLLSLVPSYETLMALVD